MDELEASACLLLCAMSRRKRKRKHQYWVHPILTKRQNVGAYNALVVVELSADEEKFEEYFRLTKQQFDELLSIVEPALLCRMTRYDSISPRQQLAVCLR